MDRVNVEWNNKIPKKYLSQYSDVEILELVNFLTHRKYSRVRFNLLSEQGKWADILYNFSCKDIQRGCVHTGIKFLENVHILYNIKFINSILEELNKYLASNKVKCTLIVYGSLALNYYNLRPMSDDINCIIHSLNNIKVNKLIREFLFSKDLPTDFINTKPKDIETSLLKLETCTVYKGTSLTLNIVSKKELLALKLFSARQDTRDFLDSYLLCSALDITDYKLLVLVLKEYIKEDCITEQHFNFINKLSSQKILTC